MFRQPKKHFQPGYTNPNLHPSLTQMSYKAPLTKKAYEERDFAFKKNPTQENVLSVPRRPKDRYVSVNVEQSSVATNAISNDPNYFQTVTQEGLPVNGKGIALPKANRLGLGVRHANYAPTPHPGHGEHRSNRGHVYVYRKDFTVFA